MPSPRYVRFRSTIPNSRGVRVGVFALVNGLARSGALTVEELGRWREANAWFEAVYPDPAILAPEVYDRDLHPHAVSWFLATATELIERTAQHAELLDAHGVPWEKVVCDDPGRILFEDGVHLVSEPDPEIAGIEREPQPFRERD